MSNADRILRALKASNIPLDDDELEFLQAMDKFRREVKPFPTVTDHLRVLKALGWRKQTQEQEQKQAVIMHP